jgi:pyruvate dehydrogenase E1 component alpha subunit
MDVEVVYEAAADAVARARAGGGPSFLEFSTCRFHGHHTFERKVPMRYRDETEVARWRERDPLLLAARRVPDRLREQIDDEVEQLVAEAVRFAVESPRPDPLDVFDHVYATAIPIRTGGGDA